MKACGKPGNQATRGSIMLAMSLTIVIIGYVGDQLVTRENAAAA
jgi:hypothetical protein